MKASDTIVFLELTHVNCLLNKNDVQLKYDIEQGMQQAYASLTKEQRDISSGVVIEVGQDNVGRFKRFYQGEQSTAKEKILRYDYDIHTIVPSSFMVQERRTSMYMCAKYAIFKFDHDGAYLLTDLADNQLRVINNINQCE